MFSREGEHLLDSDMQIIIQTVAVDNYWSVDEFPVWALSLVDCMRSTVSLFILICFVLTDRVVHS